MADRRTSSAHPLNAPPTRERLQKLLARAGLGSRRSCETLITAGRVTVDGQVATLGERADPATQLIEFDGQPLILPTDNQTIVMNKPKGYVVSRSAEHDLPSVFNLVTDAAPQLRYVGRLDAYTEGVLLFTTDGDLVHRLTHPRFEVDKAYQATLRAHPSSTELDQLRAGVALEDGWTSPAEVRVIDSRTDEMTIELVIHEGRKRQIRRMCQAIGAPVRLLRRTRFGPLDLQGLAPGESRPVTPEELAALKELARLQQAQDSTATR